MGTGWRVMVATLTASAATGGAAPHTGSAGAADAFRRLQQLSQACVAPNFFDIASLSCKACTDGTVPSDNNLYCVCDLSAGCNAVGQCNQVCKAGTCSAPEFISRDGTMCVECAAGAPAAGATDCACAGNNHLVEFDASGVRLAKKECQSCPPFTYRSTANAYDCLPCPLAAGVSMTPNPCTTCNAVGSIAEKDGVHLGECVDKNWLDTTVPRSVSDSYSTIRFFGVETSESAETDVDVTSDTFKQYFWPGLVKCLRAGEAYTDLSGPVQLERVEGCQALGNLCVLQDYDLDSNFAGVCKLFAQTGLLSSQYVNQVNPKQKSILWKEYLPWMFRDQKVRTDNSLVNLKVGFDADTDQGIISRLQFKLATYAMNGSFAGFQDLTTQLDVCSNLPMGTRGNAPEYFKIGHSVSKECQVDIQYLLSESTAGQQLFYDLYLVDADGQTLVATATKLLNFQENGAKVNIDSTSETDLVQEQFTRRFMLFDRLGSLESASATQPKVLRYPQLMKLTVPVTQSGTPPGLFVPILTIQYGSLNVADINAGELSSVVNMKFEVEYVKNLDSFWETMVLCFSITCSLGTIEWLYKIVLLSRSRPSSATVDSNFILEVLFEMFGAAARWSFLLLFGVTFYWWFFFKMQSTVHSLLPGYADREAFRVILGIGFCCKVLNMGYILYRQCRVDVFFVDWEKSHGRLIDETGDGAGEDDGNAQQSAKGETYAPISFWRTLFITNEWAELQTARMVNTELTLLSLVFLLRGCDLDNLATAQPEVESLEGPEDGGSSIDPLLHFFLGSAFIVMLSGGQMIYMKLFHHRYVSNPLEQFLDLLGLANLSGVILNGHSGWYLGADGAPHPHMDTDMHNLAKNLRKEENGVTKPRGLTESGVLTFEIHVTEELRRIYKGLYRKMMQGVHNPGASGMMHKKEHTRAHAPDDSAVAAYDQLNKFFRKFIKTTDQNSTYAHKFDTLTSGMRILPLYKPEIGKLKYSAFYEDSWLGFQSMLLYGIEPQLMTFLCWNFGLFYFLTEHTTSAACISYVVHLCMTSVRSRYGMANVARKTTIDSRFMI